MQSVQNAGHANAHDATIKTTITLLDVHTNGAAGAGKEAALSAEDVISAVLAQMQNNGSLGVAITKAQLQQQSRVHEEDNN
jgi:hypothetical protein